MISNRDEAVIAGFGDEWSRFDQTSPALQDELDELFEKYFDVFPWGSLPPNAVGFDMGCGSGRWAKRVAPRVKTLHCCDPSKDAIAVARRNLREADNVRYHVAGVSEIPFESDTMDFGYSLGVLHHIPDTRAGLAACIRVLKPGAPFLLYLYYALENRPVWFRVLHDASGIARILISRLPHRMRYLISQLVAAGIYFPLARAARVLELLGIDINNFPLSQYRTQSFYTMRTDALDRFGTSLERRFTKAAVAQMMEEVGLTDIRFREDVPYWCACGTKAR